MSVQDIATFEAQLTKLCEHWRVKLTHAELVGVLDTVKMCYHIRTIQSFEETEICETPVIKGEQATAPVKVPNSIRKKLGKTTNASPVPEEVADG